MSRIDLARLVQDKLQELGDSAAEFFGKNNNTISKWRGGTAAPDVFAAQKVLDEWLESNAAPEGGGATKTISIDDLNPPPQGATIPPKETGEQQAHRTTMTDGSDSQLLQHPADVARPAAPRKARHMFLVPASSDGGLIPAMVMSLLGNWKATVPDELRHELASLDMATDTNAHAARNVLATRFLKAEAEWSFWMDRDMIASFGNPAWFAAKTGKPFKPEFTDKAYVNKLTSYGKTIVASPYASRDIHGQLIFDGGMKPKGAPDTELMAKLRNGPVKELAQVKWAGFGCIAVHRRVFLDMIERVPEVRPADGTDVYRFFNPLPEATSHGGEDMAFCTRAAKAGHATYLDLSSICAHMGIYPFMP